MSIVQVVVGIIQQDDKVLVAERPRDKPYGGYFEFPGGKIELNESSHDALKRELMEEIGISVQKSHFWFKYEHTYPEKTVALEMWIVEEFSGVIEPKEAQRLQWVSWFEISDLPLLEGCLPAVNRMKQTL